LPSALSPTWAENEILHLVYRHHALNHEPDCYSVLDSDPGPVLDANSSRIRSGPTVNSYFANAPYSDSTEGLMPSPPCWPSAGWGLETLLSHTLPLPQAFYFRLRGSCHALLAACAGWGYHERSHRHYDYRTVPMHRGV
ncbi:hypothetical protein EVAR_98721_1, partial [Eumeta japonica]